MPFIKYTRNASGVVIDVQGGDVQLLDLLAQRLGFTYDIKKAWAYDYMVGEVRLTAGHHKV